MSRRTPVDSFERLLDRLESAVGDRNIEERVTESRLLSGVNVDVLDDGDEILVLADLPGSGKEDMTVQVDDDRLRVLGERPEEDGREYHRRERPHGTVSRTVPLPVAVETEGSKASYEDGVLSVRLPKTEIDKGEEIEIQ